MALPEFLGDDLGGGVRVQEAVAQDLVDDLLGAPVVGLGSGLVRLEGWEAAPVEGLEELVVALTAVAVFLGDGQDAVAEALAFQEHEEAPGQGVGGGDGQGAGRAGELVSQGVE